MGLHYTLEPLGPYFRSGSNLASCCLQLKIYGILLRKGNGILCEKKKSTDQKETLENSILNI